MLVASAEGVRVLQQAVLFVGVLVAHERLQGQRPKGTEANLEEDAHSVGRVGEPPWTYMELLASADLVPTLGDGPASKQHQGGRRKR